MTSSSEAMQAAQYANMFVLECETGFRVAGLQDGEAECTPIRVVCTLIASSVVSAWFSQRRLIKNLLLFFSHWLSGLVYLLSLMAKATMVSVCFAGSNLAGVVKALTFLELTAANMLAITNLAICMNLTLIVMSYRTVPFGGRRPSTPVLVLASLAVSLAVAAASAAFWESSVISGVMFWPTSTNKRATEWIHVSQFFVEFIVGACMFTVVSWLLLFWTKEIKECWVTHPRIRYFFGLTVVGALVNLALGLCGTVYVLRVQSGPWLMVMTLTFRHVHIALDTIVMHGVLEAIRDVRTVTVSSSDDCRREETEEDEDPWEREREKSRMSCRVSPASDLI